MGRALLGAVCMTVWGDFNDAAPMVDEDVLSVAQVPADRLPTVGQSMQSDAGPATVDLAAIATFLQVTFGYCDGLIPVRGFVDQGQQCLGIRSIGPEVNSHRFAHGTAQEVMSRQTSTFTHSIEPQRFHHFIAAPIAPVPGELGIAGWQPNGIHLLHPDIGWRKVEQIAPKQPLQRHLHRFTAGAAATLANRRKAVGGDPFHQVNRHIGPGDTARVDHARLHGRGQNILARRHHHLPDTKFFKS